MRPSIVVHRLPQSLVALLFVCASARAHPLPSNIAVPLERGAPRGAPARVAARDGAPNGPTATGSAAGFWREFGLLQIEQHAAFVDDAHGGLLIALGGTRTSAWFLPIAGPSSWGALPSTANQRWPYFPGSAMWDAGAGLVRYAASGNFGIEVWSYDPASGAASAIAVSGTRPEVFGAALVFDAPNQRYALIGGQDFITLGLANVWTLDLSPSPAWTEHSSIGTPTPYSAAAVVHDAARHRAVLFDARLSSSAPLGVWALALDGELAWTHLADASLPYGALRNGIVLDEAGDRVLGLDVDAQPYAYSLGTNAWMPLAAGPGPAPRTGAALAYDASRHLLIVSGGRSSSGDDVFNDTWALSLDSGTWSALVAPVVRPPIRGGAADGLDLPRRRLVVFGGSDELGGFRNDTWALDLSHEPSWSPVATPGARPPGRYWHNAAWDPPRDELLVYGGFTGDAAHPLGDVWTLGFAGPDPAWTLLAPSGSPPPPRLLTSLVYDEIHDRFLAMFGYDYTSNGYLNDLWELRLSPSPAWRPMIPSGTPPPGRAAAMVAFDAARDRVLVFGGGGANNQYLDDVWALDLASSDGTWVNLGVAPGPSARNLGLLRLDTSRDRLLLFGGYGIESQGPGFTSINYLSDTWALSLSGTPQWTALAPLLGPPPGRDRADGAYDPGYDRLILTCGGVSGSNDAWTLTFGDHGTPVEVALVETDAAPDHVRLVWQGAQPAASAGAQRRAGGGAWTTLTTLTADGVGRFELDDRDVAPGERLQYQLALDVSGTTTHLGLVQVMVPWPALSLSVAGGGGGASIAFRVGLASNAPATLTIYDVAGRRVWRRDLGALGAGTHMVSYDNARLAPALYFATLRQAGSTRGARFPIVR